MNYDFAANSMISFKNYKGFRDFYHDLNVAKWHISTGLLNDRGKYIEDRTYTHRLKNIFSEKKLFRRNVSIAEIVSWLDSYVIIRRLFRNLENTLPQEILQQLGIHCEYRIEMSKNRRIDYIFEYKNRIMLVEFRLSDKFPNVSNMWQKKELELIIYKELLNNYLPENQKIIIFAFVAMPEVDNGYKIEKNIKYNEDNVNFLARYIKKYLVQEDDSLR